MIKTNKKTHFDILDVARGFAIFLMFIYHFSFDLNYYNFIQQDFYHSSFWLNSRIIIVTLFLTIMGISLHLASYRGLNKKRFLQRLLLLLFYSLLVSISSWIMYPKAMIFFGILHLISLSTVIGLLFIGLGKFNLFLGLFLIIITQYIHHPVFDQPWLVWVGLSTKLPATVDYAPLFPWFGVILIGISLGKFITDLPKDSLIHCWKTQHAITKILALGGRYSLHIYMLHQPLFLGILYIIALLVK